MRTAIGLFVVIGLAAAQAPDPLTTARQAADGLAQRIRGVLSNEMARGGLAGAVDACSRKAQEETRAFAAENKIDIRRVSLKARNPADQPDGWEQAQLEKMEADARAGKPLTAEVIATVTEGGKKIHRYMKPITVQAMCLSCHGVENQIPGEVRKVLQSKYTKDTATGYKAGDLRGAFSVKIPD